MYCVGDGLVRYCNCRGGFIIFGTAVHILIGLAKVVPPLN
jgi:hypothetical protein